MVQIFGVVLCGGAGRRMGGADKALLRLAGQPLVTHLQDRLEPQVARLALSANGDAARLAFTGLPVLPDGAGAGPLAGILVALDWAATAGADAVVSAAVDTPFLPCDLVPRLWLAGDGGLAVARCNGRLHPTAGLWPISLRAALRAQLDAGQFKVMAFAEDAAVADFSTDTPDPFLNLNTPEDLALAERALAET